MSEDKKKIVLNQSEIQICKMFAADGLDKAKAEAEANGLPFDYEAEKAKREHEFIMLFAAEKAKDRDWEEERDKAFHLVIPEVIRSTKLYNYVRNHVLDFEAMRKLDPADILKVQGYGKKTADELRDIQTRFRNHPKIVTRINAAIKQQRHMSRFLSEHGTTIGQYSRLRAETRHTRMDVSNTWRYYGG